MPPLDARTRQAASGIVPCFAQQRYGGIIPREGVFAWVDLWPHGRNCPACFDVIGFSGTLLPLVKEGTYVISLALSMAGTASHHDARGSAAEPADVAHHAAR